MKFSKVPTRCPMCYGSVKKLVCVKCGNSWKEKRKSNIIPSIIPIIKKKKKNLTSSCSACGFGYMIQAKNKNISCCAIKKA